MSPASPLENPEEISMIVGLISLILLFLAGLMLGSLYFGGLWITLRRLPRWNRPFLGMGLSFLGRLAILLGGGAWLMKHPIAPPLQAILLMSVGVWLSRTLLISRLLAAVNRDLSIRQVDAR
jgi:F1F0 ATPase subunit 2